MGALPAVALLPFKGLPSLLPLRFDISQPQAPTPSGAKGLEGNLGDSSRLEVEKIKKTGQET